MINVWNRGSISIRSVSESYHPRERTRLSHRREIDRKLWSDNQLGSDDLRIARHRDLHASAQPPCGQGRHQSLQIHAHADACGLAIGYPDSDFSANKLHIGRHPVAGHVVFLDN